MRRTIKVAFKAFLTVLLLAVTASCATYPRAGVNRIRRIDLYPENLPAVLDGYRIAFISDTHYGNNFGLARLDRLTAAVNAEKPDCILLGGDYALSSAEMAEFVKSAGRLEAPEGTYAVSGNHDFYNGQQGTCAALRNAGIVVLDENAVTTPRGVTVAGINHIRDIYPDAKLLSGLVRPEGFTVLVSHHPDFAEETNLSPFDLMLSGHTHGGQITFFGFAPVLPSEFGQKYRTGTVEKDGTPVIVSNGAGYGGTVLRFRFCAPSDFLLITLHAPAPTKGR